MIRLRTKPVEITAVLYDGSRESYKEVLRFAGPSSVVYNLVENQLSVWNYLEQQWIRVPEGHYVLKGLKGEFYPCEAEALFMKYEVVNG